MIGQLAKSKQQISNTIRSLILQENPSLLEKLDYNNDEIFLEPLLFAFFNGKKENLFPHDMLEEIMQGYFLKEYPIQNKHPFNKNKITYIPNRGFFLKKKKVPLEPQLFIKGTNIEVLKYPVSVLDYIYKDFSDQMIPSFKIKINKTFIEQNIPILDNAFGMIKGSSQEYFNLITFCCKRIALFKTDPANTNSFATINAHGVAFLNVFQEDIDEVHFVDDIAHQTGHIILTTLFFDREKFFKIEEYQSIGLISSNKAERRSLYILFQALYTYYTTINCLENCLKDNLFTGKQIDEAIARIGFYQKKYFSDLQKFERYCIDFKGIENVLEKEGVILYSLIKEKFYQSDKDLGKITCQFDYSNQPYNFSFKEFLKMNKENLKN